MLSKIHALEFYSTDELKGAQQHAAALFVGTALLLLVAGLVLLVLQQWAAAAALGLCMAAVGFALKWWTAAVIALVLIDQRGRKGQGWGRGNG